jgi:Domain of unknown function (DUF4145)
MGTIRVRCPHCRRETHAGWSLPTSRDDFSYSTQPYWSQQKFGELYTSGETHALQTAMTRCPENGCRAPMMLTVRWYDNAENLKESLRDNSWHLTPEDGRIADLLEVLPFEGLGATTMRELPENIQAEFPAAVELAAQGRAPATASTTCRSCLEEALKSLELRAISEEWLAAPLQGNLKLYQRINALVAAGVITKDIGAWSHEVRLIANEGAHELRASVEDVRELVSFMNFFFEALFAMPARLTRLRAARAKKP